MVPPGENDMQMTDTFMMAALICDIIEAHLTPEDFDAVKSGAKNPDDLMDVNSAMYGAYCALHFEPPELESHECFSEMNLAMMHAEIYDFNREKVRRNASFRSPYSEKEQAT